jgi:hypothetical protein
MPISLESTGRSCGGTPEKCSVHALGWEREGEGEGFPERAEGREGEGFPEWVKGREGESGKEEYGDGGWSL